ncbi:hypothetical protein PsorP6_010639 [Peronosclerospora sorghi]|uniref:Uncharacterized protein n=1 Tax=Peronosclerospora sorghi TaxID=230839 RepID=A0ACC0VYH8_9STRA|nr:hypothetical protein PsorP6_010639 [Peronosclerospora sorghi]
MKLSRPRSSTMPPPTWKWRRQPPQQPKQPNQQPYADSSTEEGGTTDDEVDVKLQGTWGECTGVVSVL